MPEDAKSAGLLSALSGLTPFVVPALGFIYATGLFVVNLNLRREGIIDLDLAKPGYLIVGGLWAVLTGTLLCFYFFGARRGTATKERRILEQNHLGEIEALRIH
jgi:hypothetical protein